MTTSEKLLMGLESAVLRSDTQSRRLARRDAYDAIAWYVNTCRAGPAWVRSALRANPGKLLDFVGAGSVMDEVNRATAYLHRYCGLRLPGQTG